MVDTATRGRKRLLVLSDALGKPTRTLKGKLKTRAGGRRVRHSHKPARQKTEEDDHFWTLVTWRLSQTVYDSQETLHSKHSRQTYRTICTDECNAAVRWLAQKTTDSVDLRENRKRGRWLYGCRYYQVVMSSAATSTVATAAVAAATRRGNVALVPYPNGPTGALPPPPPAPAPCLRVARFSRQSGWPAMAAGR